MDKVYLITEERLKGIMMEAIDEYRKWTAESGSTARVEEYLDTKQVCAVLGISTRTFQRWRDENSIPFIQRGRKIYVKRSDLDAFQDANLIEARQ